jgi:hypothetical protein
MANYIGKIAAVGTINMAQFSRGLDNSAKDVERFAKRISSTLSSANSAAARSFDQIFTPIQRLERAIQARSRDRLNIDTGGAEARIRALVGAAEDIARPLGSSAKAFSGLSATIQNEFVGSLVRAQNAATTAQNNITRGAIKNAQDYERYKRVVDETVISIRRLSEAGSAVSGLATGRELRFQQADLASELQRASASQSAASALPADARRSGAVAQLVELQRREAEEAARLLSVLENIRNTRRGDAAAAQAALDAQVQRLGQVNSQLERQAALSAQVAQRQREVAQAQEQAATRFSATELNRRSGELARRNASAFDAATAGVLSQPQDRGVVFGRRVNTIETELSRLDQLGQRFLALPENVRQSLEGQRAAVENLANAARQNPAGGLTLLAEAIDRLDDVVRTTERGIREFRPIPGNADGEFGPPNPSTLVSTRDPTGRTIQQRIRDIAAEREQRAAAEEAIADRRRRVEVASTFLPPVITSPDPNAQRTAQLQGISDRLGPDIASSAAEFARLEAATVQVKNQIDQLPAGVRTRFIPAIRDAENELLRLAATDASPEELERATQRVVQLRQEVGRAERAFNAFGGSFRNFADATDFTRAAGRLTALRQQLARATGDTTQAESAADRYAATLQRAANAPGGFRRLAAEINQVEQEAIRATAAVSGISPRRLTENLNRAGDVGRGAFGNVGLAVQQATFAVDDFFSVTGDISQRIRAIGNNVSQLGFVLDGTRGLIIGVAASLGAQAVVALIRWANAGVEATDRTRALNDALSRQKTLVDQLAESFRNLGQSITLGAFSGGARDAEEFRRQIEQLRQQQREAQRERAASLDPTVQRERAVQAARERELQNATTVGQVVALRREIEQSQARERRAAEAAAARPPVAAADVSGIVARQVQQQAEAAFADLGQALEIQIREGEARRREFEAGPGAAVRTTEDARLLLERRRDELSARRRRAGGAEQVFIDRQLQEIASLLAAIQRDDIARIGEEAINVVISLRAAALGIGQAQDDVREAIRQGLPNAVLFNQRLTAAAEALTAAEREVNDATTSLTNAQQLPANDPDREGAIRDAERRRQSAVARVSELQRSGRRLEDEAFAFRQRLALDPQSTFDARAARVRQNLDASRAPEGQLARALRQLEFQRNESVRQLEDARSAQDPLTQRLAQQSIDALSIQISTLEAATRALRTFTEAIARAEDGVASRAQQAQQALDDAIERDVAFSTPQSRRDVERAREDRDRQRRSAANAQAELASQRARAEEDIRRNLPDVFEEQQAILEQLASGNLSARTEAVLRRRLAELDAQTEPFRRRAEADAEAATRQDIFERQRPLLEAAGQQFLQSPGQRAAEQLARDLEGIRLAAARTAEETTGLIDEAAVGEARQRAFRQAAEQAAPLLVGFSDEVANALLQGPSRAALQASDASTLQGQQELNRLLRGEDPARDVNLVELQKQTQALNELVQIGRAGPQVAP